MLVGRREEQARIRRLLAAARRGRSGALVVRGEAGIGKTALLDGAARSARGMTVLRTQGFESEAELPYGGLQGLLRPVLGLVSTLPRPQAEGLTAALALGPAPPTDPLVVCAATLSLLAAGAEAAPVLVVADDAHWLDRESAQAIGFAARRLGEEGVAVLVGVRDGEASSFATDGLEELALGGLGAVDVTTLLGGRVIEAVAVHLTEATGGNPLALIELAAMLSDEQRAGVEPVAEPLAVGPALERAFGRRLAGLAPPARTALLVAATAGERNELEVLGPVWERLGLARSDVAAGERAGLVSLDDGRVRFRHPLVRAAAYASASAPDRRSAHAALAAALWPAADADVRAWHLALAAAGPDEEAAAELEAAGRRAQGRSRDAAYRALRQAAVLTPAGPARTARTLAAARAASDAGLWEDAARLLEHPSSAAGEGAQGTERLLLLGVVSSRRGGGRAAAEILEQAGEQLIVDDPEAAALAFVEAAGAWTRAQQYERAAAAARRAESMPFRRAGKTELAVLLSRGDTAGWLGDLEDAIDFWRRAAELLDESDPEQLQMAGEALFSAGDDAGARRLLRRAEELSRERASLGTLTIVLHLLALTEMRAGHYLRAHAAAVECATLMQAIGQRDEQPGVLGDLAWIEAVLGREEACRRHVADAVCVLSDLGHNAPFGGSGIGLLELSRGRPARALDALRPTIAVRRSRLDAEVIAPRPVLPVVIESLWRAGERTEATALLRGKLESARTTARPDAIAPLLRCEGLVRGDEGSFVEALDWHERWSNGWERARTELCYGEFLRRLKRRADARTLLRAALEGFEEVGAPLWAARARGELAATGERARRRVASTVDDLTPQELQVASLVATGLTNREVAERLFLSPKTIETHLGHVFRKTGIRTRGELAHRFRDSPDSIASPAS